MNSHHEEIHRATICLFRRTAGRLWWRVDASVNQEGDIVIVSGDASEWHAIVRGGEKNTLLAALRRTGDLVAGIGSTPEEEILARLHECFYRDPTHPTGPFEEIKAFLANNGVVWEAQFWGGDEISPPVPKQTHALIELLGAARALVARPGNDFTWCSWESADDAVAEFDHHLRILAEGGEPDRVTIATLFAPTGPMQELSLGSGWSGAFLKLADAVDRLFEVET